MEAEKRTNAERNEQEDILAALKYLTESVEGLKAEIAALHAENEQLKQSIQTADLAFIISLAGINNTNEQFAIDYLKVANYFIDDRIIQYLARVALAKHINDMTEENNAYRWVEDKLKYSDIYKKHKQWHDKIENASAPEIVQMIKQLMNSAVVQKQEESTGLER